MDIKHVEHVVHYDAPVNMRKYVHRVGRTGRAGRTGKAWTSVGEQEVRGWSHGVSARLTSFPHFRNTADHAAAVNSLRLRELHSSRFTEYGIFLYAVTTPWLV
ncbi:hypothetical protein EDB86DRAFT_119856 [Lactarius hatsudake]|nr:hypothetical protein EDB86DRAFT_119856 [Lactarius hatsudake]